MDGAVNLGAGNTIAATQIPGNNAQEYVLQFLSILDLRKASLMPIRLFSFPFYHHHHCDDCRAAGLECIWEK